MSGLYRRVAVASTFSPRFQAVICEADRLARRLDIPLSVVHADLESDDKALRFREALKALHRPADTPLLWAEDTTTPPADSILAACRRGEVDLLLAGALERDNDHRFFLGGVARGLLQKSLCDLVLMTRPSEDEVPVKHAVIEVDLANPVVPALQKGLHVAQRLGAEQVTFISVVTPFEDAASANNNSRPHNEESLTELVDPLTGFDGEAEVRIIRTTTGFGACDFVQGAAADLLIVITGTQNGMRMLPHHMDWLLQVIPTNVLLLGSQSCQAQGDSDHFPGGTSD